MIPTLKDIGDSGVVSGIVVQDLNVYMNRHGGGSRWVVLDPQTDTIPVSKILSRTLWFEWVVTDYVSPKLPYTYQPNYTPTYDFLPVSLSTHRSPSLPP